MDTIPDPERGSIDQPSDQFEAFVYDKSFMTSSGSFRWHKIPPPMFVRDPRYSHSKLEITSYAVVGGGSRCPYICISVEDAGTYCMDTVSHTWTHIGNWTLPFCGKVEYVPELKLWFGLSTESGHLAAADLSTIFTMDCQPELVSDWKELDFPEDWEELQDPQLVNLDSGRFCIARFFETMSSDVYVDDNLIDQNLVVLTGVKVSPGVLDGRCSGSGTEVGKANHELTTLQSRYHVSNGSSIEAVF